MEKGITLLGRGRALSRRGHEPIVPIGVRNHNNAPTIPNDTVLPVTLARGTHLPRSNQVPIIIPPGRPTNALNNQAETMDVYNSEEKENDLKENGPRNKKKFKSVEYLNRIHKRISTHQQISSSSENGSAKNNSIIELPKSSEHKSLKVKIEALHLNGEQEKSPEIEMRNDALPPSPPIPIIILPRRPTNVSNKAETLDVDKIEVKRKDGKENAQRKKKKHKRLKSRRYLNRLHKNYSKIELPKFSKHTNSLKIELKIEALHLSEKQEKSSEIEIVRGDALPRIEKEKKFPEIETNSGAFTPFQNEEKLPGISGASRPTEIGEQFPEIEISSDDFDQIEIGNYPEIGINADDAVGETRNMNHFTMGELLGKGTFGEVYQVKDDSGKKFAMKVMVGTSNTEEYNLWEIKVTKYLSRLNCGQHNCIQLLKYYRMGAKRYLQFPLYGPTIGKVIHPSSGCDCRRFLVPQINDILKQLFSALSFLHHHGVVHADIKCDNVIFVKGNSHPLMDNYVQMHNTEIRLIDFGLSIFRPNQLIKRVCCKPFEPPESILKGIVSYPVDIWSVGLVALIMYTGHGIFKIDDDDRRLETLAQMEILLGKFPSRLLNFPEADKYFWNNNTIRPYTFKAKLLYHIRPLKKMKTNSSLEDDRLFDLIAKMLQLDSEMRPTSNQLIRMIQY